MEFGGELRDYLDERFTVREHPGDELRIGGACPFCGKDKRDLALVINSKTGLGFCHHCSKGFGFIQFVMENESCSKSVAWRIIREKVGGGFVKAESDYIEVVPWPETIPAIESAEARRYLNSRNVSDEMIESFEILYCHTNMAYCLDGVSKLYRTSGRVIIPIRNEEGDLVGWQGRDIIGRSKVKYLFPPLFDAGDYLYNVYRIDKDENYLILTEGVFHVFGWSRFGISNVVGTFGKKISGGQLDTLLSAKIHKILLAWDSDASLQKYDFCEKYGHLFDIRIIDLDGRDADEVDKGYLIKALVNAKKYSWKDKILNAISH